MTEASDVNFGFEISASLIAKLAMAALGFIGTIVFARVLGPMSFGAFYLLMALVDICERPINGIATGAKKRFSEVGSNQSEIVGAQLAAIGGASILVIMSIGIARDPLSSYIGIDSAPALFILLFVTLTLFRSLSTLLTATGRMSIDSVIDFFGSILTLPFQLVLVLAGFGVAGMVYGLSGATLVASLLAAYVLNVRPIRPSQETLRSVWRFARYSIFSSLVNKAYSRFDVLLLGVLLSSSTVGYYEVANRLTMPAVYLSATIGTGLMARVSNFDSKDDTDSIREDIKNTASFASILAVPMFFGALALADPLVVTLYGNDYAPAAPILVGLALYQAIKSQTVPFHAPFQGLDRPDISLRIGAITLGFNIVLGIGLAFVYGTLGVVIATVVAEGLRYGLAVWCLRRELDGYPILTRGLLEQIVGGLIMYGVLVAILTQITVSSWIGMISLVGGGALLYGGVLTVISPQLRMTSEQIVTTMRQKISDYSIS